MENNNSFLVLFLAPVKEYLEDDSVSEILINGPQQVYVERGGKLEEVAAKFVSEPALKAAATNIAKSVGRILDEMHPRLDARLLRTVPNDGTVRPAAKDKLQRAHQHGFPRASLAGQNIQAGRKLRLRLFDDRKV